MITAIRPIRPVTHPSRETLERACARKALEEFDQTEFSVASTVSGKACYIVKRPGRAHQPQRVIDGRCSCDWYRNACEPVGARCTHLQLLELRFERLPWAEPEVETLPVSRLTREQVRANRTVDFPDD